MSSDVGHTIGMFLELVDRAAKIGFTIEVHDETLCVSHPNHPDKPEFEEIDSLEYFIEGIEFATRAANPAPKKSKAKGKGSTADE